MAGDAFRLSPPGQTSWLAQEHFHLSANPLRKIGKNGRSRSSLRIDSDGRRHLSRSRKRVALCLLRKFQTASQPDMPQNAVKTGCVDQLLSPAEIAVQLGRIGKERARSVIRERDRLRLQRRHRRSANNLADFGRREGATLNERNPIRRRSIPSDGGPSARDRRSETADRR